MSELPEELLEEILCRVPAASLKRLRSTCKRWNGLFNDRRFARKHFDKATKQSLTLTFKESRICSMSINLHKIPPVEFIGQFNLTDLRSSLDQTKILQVSHCDGLLLCVINTGFVVWNPCTSQTRWIINHHKQFTKYALGSYQDKISNDISYKILRYMGYGYNQEFRVYDMNSNSWRILDVTSDFSLREYLNWIVFLKGKTYWIATDEKEEPIDKFLLVSFDYTTERFECLSLPPSRRYPSYRKLYLSVVREEKLSVLLQRDGTSKTEIWVTNKIGEENKVVSWSMVLAFDEFGTCYNLSFWIDEEDKKALVWGYNFLDKAKTIVRIVGEDIKVERELFTDTPFLFNYVPSLCQI